MITLDNYQDKKDSIDWKQMPAEINSVKTDIEGMMEFYDEDSDIKDAVDLFLKGVNKNSKPTIKEIADNSNGRINIVKVAPVDVDKPTKASTDAAIDKASNGTKKWREVAPEVRNVMLYGKFKDQKAFKAIGDGRQVENLLYATIYPIENMDKLITSLKPTEDGIQFQIRVAGGSKVLWDSKDVKFEKKTTSKPAPKAKVAKVIIDKKIITITPEFLLIRRFWNIIKSEHIVIPFRTTQLLNMAFNKAAVERKVRKTSDAADLFVQCQKKINMLFQEFAAPTQADVKVEFEDKKLYKEIKEYVTESSVNPAIPVLNRFIAMQNTLPDVKKAETLLKAIEKVLDNDKIEENKNRLTPELNQAKVALSKYIAKPKETIEPKVYGLSVPAVCTNRVKCAGIDKTGKLHKGYKFQEHTGNVIRVRKTKSRLASPKVCENRVKCTGLSKTGKLLKGYKFEEGTNHVIKVGSTKKRKSPSKKKVVAGLGYSDRLEFQEVERIYVSNPAIPVINQPLKLEEKVDLPQVSNTNVEVIEDKKVSSPKNKLMQMQFDSLDLDQGWEKFMQNPAKNMKVAIWGKPKNGKTAGSLQLADYLSKFGKVLYNFADQGFNKSTQDLWKMSGLANNENAEPSDVQTLDALEKEIATGKYTFVFIDMISDYINKENIKPYEFKERFMKKYPNVSFILIFEVTKGGDFKGDQGWTHIVDAIVTVEDFLMENRGRYGVGSHIVWDEGFKKFNPKRYDEVTAELAPEVELSFSEEVERI